MPINGQSLYINEVENSGDISGTYNIGGILGYVQYSNRVYISNAKNKKTGMIESSSGGGGTGGIVGHIYGGSSCVIDDSENETTIQLEGYSYGGGLVGYIYNTSAQYINQSHNEGDIIYTKTGSYYSGGLVGYITSGSLIAIKTSYNTGNIINNSSGYNGGLIGYKDSGTCQVEESYNTGTIVQGRYVGGIIGCMNGNSSQMNRCYNFGNLTQVYENCGGLIGYGSGGIINDCNNYGSITTVNKGTNHMYTGGIVGFSNRNLNVLGCTNFGNISVINPSKSCTIGGIIGINSSVSISGCSNQGNITVEGCNSQSSGSYEVYEVGGIGARLDGNVNNSYNTGKIYVSGSASEGRFYIGGIDGEGSPSVGISYNTGDITVSVDCEYTAIGGISGSGGSIGTSFNTGNINCSIESDNMQIGGIAGNASSINNCYNTGEIVDSSSSNSGSSSKKIINTGGIAGSCGTITNTYNTGSIYDTNSYLCTDVSPSANNYVGPIYGRISGSSSKSNWYPDDLKVVSKVKANETYCTKTTEEHMLTDDFCEELGGSAQKWMYIENQYPTLDIAIVNSKIDATEITVKNKKKTFDITGQIMGNVGGNITGTTPKYSQKYVRGDIKFIEEVKYGESSTVEVKITPTTDYVIQKITVNGEEIGFTTDDEGKCVLPAGYFENVTEDIDIVAYVVKKSGSLTINKTDKEGNKLAGAKFKIESDDMKDSEIKNLTANDDYYFADNSGSFSPTNNGTTNTTAKSYYEIDLTGKEEDFIVQVKVDFQGGIFYGMVTDSSDDSEYNEENAFMRLTEAEQSSMVYATKVLEHGNKYYVHFVYKIEDTPAEMTLLGLKLLPVDKKVNEEPEGVGNFYFVKNEDGYVPKNQSISTTSYIPINLEGKEGKYAINVEATAKTVGTLSAYIVDSIESDDTSRSVISASDNGRQGYCSQTIDGGKKYYLKLVTQNVTNQSEIKINNINIVIIEKPNVVKETNGNGQIVLEAPIGKYIITEVEPPEGYQLDSTPNEITVSSDGKNVLNVENEKLKEVVIHYYLKDENETATRMTEARDSGTSLQDNNNTNGNLVISKIKEIINETTNKRNAEPISLKEDVHIYGNSGDEYNTSEYVEYELQGYTLEVDENNNYVIPDNAAGEFGQDVIHVNYYYEKKTSKLTSISINKKWNLPEDLVDDYRATIRLVKVENNRLIPVYDSNGDEITREIRGNGTAIIENLLQYDEDGTEIEYGVEEIKVEKVKSINEETQEEIWEELPLEQFKATYNVKEQE